MKSIVLPFFLLAFFHAFSQAIDSAFFGIHNGDFLAKEQQIIFPAMRLWDTGVRWNQLEPEEGKWNFDRFDKIISFAQSKNIELVYVLGQTPSWASSRPEDSTGVYGKGANYPPKSIKLWENYLKVVGERYKGKIKYYEVWNEPNFPIFFNGDVREMTELTVSASKILKAIDPEIKIISPGIVAGTFDWLPSEKQGTIWMESYLKLTPPQYFDIAGAHFYTPEKSSPEQELIPIIRNFKRVLTENFITKPIWNTEQGYGAMEACQKKKLSRRHGHRHCSENAAD
jgi:polysaccharide biosynthesis protein PslG